MISDAGGFIFIDIPRTAGTAVGKALKQVFKCCEGKHHSITNICADYDFCTYIDRDQIRDYFKFTIVRNPFDRLVSLYMWGVKSIYRKYTFSAFVHAVRDGVFTELNGHRYLPQVAYIRDRKGNIKVDYIGRYEILKTSFREILRKLDVDKPVKLERYNTSEYRSRRPRLPYQNYYTKDDIKVVSELYKEDLELFEYCF